MKRWKVAGINFDHGHMDGLLGGAFKHENAEIVGISDEHPERMQPAVGKFNIPPERVFTDYRACMEKTKPDLVIICSATGEHVDWTEKVAPYGAHVFVEKPFSATLAEADRMIAALKATGKQLIINWPLRWYPCHITAKRLIDEGVIGNVIEVHYYDGNRGPLTNLGNKMGREAVLKSWWYQKATGGGSLLDYLGYGVTLGTWFHNGRKPIEITAVADQSAGVEVDEHSITIARYDCGLSKYETRWGTFTNPWDLQPQPKCGFVIKGDRGTISSYDYEPSIRVQTGEKPEGYVQNVDVMEAPHNAPIPYVLHCLDQDKLVEGPLSPAMSRIGQQIVDSAALSAANKCTVPLVDTK